MRVKTKTVMVEHMGRNVVLYVSYAMAPQGPHGFV